MSLAKHLKRRRDAAITFIADGLFEAPPPYFSNVSKSVSTTAKINCQIASTLLIFGMWTHEAAIVVLQTRAVRWSIIVLF
jgi:hypothetical protein